jgi:hypothetical protein
MVSSFLYDYVQHRNQMFYKYDNDLQRSIHCLYSISTIMANWLQYMYEDNDKEDSLKSLHAV